MFARIAEKIKNDARRPALKKSIVDTGSKLVVFLFVAIKEPDSTVFFFPKMYHTLFLYF